MEIKAFFDKWCNTKEVIPTLCSYCNKQELPYETVLIIAIVQIVNASHFMLERYVFWSN